MAISNLNNIQGDVLWEDTSLNPNLPSSPVTSLNKALKTTNKRVINAINEVNTTAQSVKTSNQNLINQLNKSLGDFSNGIDGIDIITAIKDLQTELEALKTGGTGTGTGSAGNDGSFLLNF